jgi:hypothetical protein
MGKGGGCVVQARRPTKLAASHSLIRPNVPYRPPPTLCSPTANRSAANMSKGSKYLLVSLPTSISPSNHADEALTALRSTVTNDVGSTSRFAIPNFKIGTLDALVQQADDLAKLDSACQGVVSKVGDSLRSILDGDEAKVQQQKTINDSMWHDPYNPQNSPVVQSRSISICARSSGTRSSTAQTSPLPT